MNHFKKQLLTIYGHLIVQANENELFIKGYNLVQYPFKTIDHLIGANCSV